MAGKRTIEGEKPREKPRHSGRPKKSGEAASARIGKRLAELKIQERQRKELMSLVSAMFCRGYTSAEIETQLIEDFPKSYACLVRGENFWDLLREAAMEKMFTHTPCDDFELIQRLQEDYPWLHEHVVVSQTAASDALAERSANKLLDMIRTVRRQQQCDTVHVGFAGGMTLRAVAEKLAQLLNHHHPDNPETLVFHAMVANFDDDDFYADPNSFITYFIKRNRRVKVRLVRLPLPGIIETARAAELLRLPGIDRVFQRCKEIQIIVTSGSLWDDDHSTLRTYLDAAWNESQHRTGSGPADDLDREEADRKFREQGVVGDLLWQPINKDGAVQFDSAYKVTTLMGLDELPDFIQRGGSVLLVMGCSGISHMPKSELLRAILELHPEQNWVTDVVTDSPTVEGMYFPGIRAKMTQPLRRVPRPR